MFLLCQHPYSTPRDGPNLVHSADLSTCHASRASALAACARDAERAPEMRWGDAGTP
jgi:hypothetical protein